MTLPVPLSTELKSALLHSLMEMKATARSTWRMTTIFGCTSTSTGLGLRLLSRLSPILGLWLAHGLSLGTTGSELTPSVKPAPSGNWA